MPDPRDQAVPYDPIPDVEARDAGYIDWLLAGGAPLPEFSATAWADTEKEQIA